MGFVQLMAPAIFVGFAVWWIMREIDEPVTCSCGDSDVVQMAHTKAGDERMTYEYTFGVYVEADDEQQAWDEVREISEALDKVDVEGKAETDGPYEVTPTV